MMRSSVDLPPPLGPSTAVSWPDSMSTVTSSSAWKSPNDLLTSRTWMLMQISLRRRPLNDVMPIRMSSEMTASSRPALYAAVGWSWLTRLLT